MQTSPIEDAPRHRARKVIALAAAGVAAAGIAVLAANPAGAVPAQGSGCAAVSIITARASTESAGEGITGALAQAIQNDSKQTVSRASVNYPATLNNYANSAAQGVSAETTQLTNLVNSCPNTKVVLLGYSQGAHVSLGVLGGNGGGNLGGTSSNPISANIASHVVAVAVFGDPRHVVNQAIDQGTSTTNGLFPRTAAQSQVLAGMSSKIHSWCDANDEFCSSGASLQVHLTYLNRYQGTAESFVLGKVGG